MKITQSTALTITGILFILLIITASAGGAFLAIGNHDKVSLGVTLDNVPLNDMSEADVRKYVEDTAKKSISLSTINLSYENRHWTISPKAIDLKVDTDKLVEEIYAPGHTGDILQRISESLECALKGHPVVLRASFNEDALDKQLEAIGKQLLQSPSSATCCLAADGTVQHVPMKKGLKLDVVKLYDQLSEPIKKFQLPKDIKLEPEITLPPIMDQDLAAINSILASYTTYFSEGDWDRSENIRISSQALNQALVKPNQVMSFNDRVGHRDTANGYRTAPVIVDGKVQQDIGGGVCQVSSTLYNAILYAGLTPTERTAHYYPSTYVPAGRDATVADGNIDFKFRNQYPHVIYLLTSCYSGQINVFVLGCWGDKNGTTYKLYTDIEKPGPGPIVTLYRQAYQNGNLISTEKMHTDNYDIPS